jgi:hypothetical protein
LRQLADSQPAFRDGRRAHAFNVNLGPYSKVNPRVCRFQTPLYATTWRARLLADLRWQQLTLPERATEIWKAS